MHLKPKSQVGIGHFKFVNPGGLFFPLLIRLPNSPGRDIQTGQPPLTANPSVDADGVADVDGPAVFLGGVPANHRLSGTVGGGVVELLPK